MSKTYKLGGKTIRSMLGICSGTVAAKASVVELLANKINGLAFIVTKSINALGNKGYNTPIIARRGPYSLINAVGLANIGAIAFAEELSKISLPKDFFLMGSVFGATPEEFVAAAVPLLPFVHGIEANISCGHSKKYGWQVGQDLELVIAINKALVKLGLPVYDKLSYKMDIALVVNSTKNLGIAGYSVVNTRGPEEFEVNGQPVLSNIKGGVSGREINSLMLKCLRIARENTSLEIIASGGISNGQDVATALAEGATVCAIGSGFTGMSTAQMAKYVPLVLADAEHGTTRSRGFIDNMETVLSASMEYRKFEVAENKALADDLFVLRFTEEINAGPGQFVFVWIPGKGERPFSVLDANPLSMLVSIRGDCTRFMSQLKPGDWVHVRGPHGNVPKVSGKILLVGGGTGIASLYQFAKNYGRWAIPVLGAKDVAHLYDNVFKHFCRWVYSFTETARDLNIRGLVTDHLGEIVRSEKPDFCLNCGPLGMVKAAIAIEEQFLPENNILSSVEFHTDCGVGICGKDATPKGFRPCVDGTFMTKTQLGL